MYDYEWDGVGLTITTPAGTVYIQGEEGSNLYDELEELDSDQLEVVLLLFIINEIRRTNQGVPAKGRDKSTRFSDSTRN